MRLFSLFVSVVVAALAGVRMAAVRWFERVFDLLKPEPFRFSADGFGFVGSTGGIALDPALANSLRFEAGHSRRAAPRNT